MRRAFSFGLTVWGLLTLLPSCHRCQDLTDKICSDLGAKDCAAWKEADGPGQVNRGGRGGNRLCGDIMSNDLAYEGTLNGARGTALVRRLTVAQQKGDKAEVAAVTAQLADNKKRIEEGLKKLRR